MPMPDAADVHLNRPLTNVSVRYQQQTGDYLADKVFPRVPVDHKNDVYNKYSKSDWRRTDAKKRAPGTESAGTGWNATTDDYSCDVYALHHDIDDPTRANADSNWHLDRDSTEFVTGQVLLQRDLIWTETYFKTGVWGTEFNGVSANPDAQSFLQWDSDLSNPLQNKSRLQNKFKLSTGFKFTDMTVGADVWEALENHPAILDRIKFTQTGVVTEELVAKFFGVQRFHVAYASQAIGEQINDAAAQDAQMTYEYITDPKSVLLSYAPRSPRINTPSAGYTFTWKGYIGGNKEGLATSKFRMQHIKSDRIEVEAAYGMKVVSPDCGVFLKDIVS